MTAPATWVVGSHGLLGQHVARLLPGSRPTSDVPWLRPDEAKSSLRQGIRGLLDQAAGGPWAIAWCAGAGVVATAAEQIEQERQVFASFVADLGELTSGGGSGEGVVFFASSAGGVYADSAGAPFTEETPPRPRTPYGRAKLAMEADLREFAARSGTPVLVGRIANLYGPGQNLTKPQGLVSQICRAHLTGQPLSLYVSPDTMRDYLYVEDCARMVVAGLAGLAGLEALRSRAAGPGADPVVTKILASGRSVTAGGLIGESTRLFRRRPRVVFGSSASARLQVRDLRLRSIRWPELDRLARTPLPVGIARTADDIARRLRA